MNEHPEFSAAVVQLFWRPATLENSYSEEYTTFLRVLRCR